MIRILLASLHLLAFGIGLGAVWVRARALAALPDPARLATALRADSLWGLAAFLWLSTGLWRWLGGIEKDASYYTGNYIFLTKMGLFVLVVLLEIRPVVTLGKWRRQLGAKAEPNLGSAGTLSRISYVQAGILLLMILAATSMARGYGS
jgi:putative membrane protein